MAPPSPPGARKEVLGRLRAGGSDSCRMRKVNQSRPPPPRHGSSHATLPAARAAQVDSLTSTSRQLPGTKWMESSFSRPTMPAVFAPPPPPRRPPLPPAPERQGPQLPHPRPASLGPGRPPRSLLPASAAKAAPVDWPHSADASERGRAAFCALPAHPPALKGIHKKRPWP